MQFWQLLPFTRAAIADHDLPRLSFQLAVVGFEAPKVKPEGGVTAVQPAHPPSLPPIMYR